MSRGLACTPVVIDSGSISGVDRPNATRAFYGIPYAAPPVGELRWRPPQPVQHWEGVRSGESYGPACVQPPPPKASLYSTVDAEFSEDCLYLNIFTGAENSTDRPVLVWFHYGAFVFGSAAHPMEDGARLAAEGITVVTVNFRVGRFGFLALPELSAESGHNASGNYGIMDQISALEWVQRNIKAFGGDPGNVTIGGASSGGASVTLLRTSPLAKGLFTKGICESGPGLAPALDGPGHIATYMTLTAAEAAGTEVLNALGASSLAELRQMPSDKILAVTLPRTKGIWKSYLRENTTSLSVYDTQNPIIDGYVVPRTPAEAFMSGEAVDIPVLAGATGDDGTALPRLYKLSNYESFLQETFEGQADNALRLYPATTDAEVIVSSWRLLADQVFRWPTWTSARLQHKYMKSPVWYYDFLRAPPIPTSSSLVEKNFAGAFHLVGMLYGLGNLDAWDWDWTNADRSLSRKMMETWVHFMRTGNPNDSTQGATSYWPALSANSEHVRIWDDTGDLRLEQPAEHARQVTAFWDKYYGYQI
ncbi:alpha/beta-hydrolase [Xylaria bambusicola]|uniref:alpha/beta-hydrolase n=1 Tax=Xylaria bambusicola TaxID=326684 RepID=UPI0020088706|nr:alpha/beta-hydrolase [Xylaria bambusicola]KAI0502865.1 alpha/beta-hydrolase [Xylaria bambusicola]